jgi:hypothetical protein
MTLLTSESGLNAIDPGSNDIHHAFSLLGGAAVSVTFRY